MQKKAITGYQIRIEECCSQCLDCCKCVIIKKRKQTNTHTYKYRQTHTHTQWDLDGRNEKLGEKSQATTIDRLG